MNDERDPQDTRPGPEPLDEQNPVAQPEDEQNPVAQPEDDLPAEEFESQPAATHSADEDATSEWPANDPTDAVTTEPPPGEVEAYASQPPAGELQADQTAHSVPATGVGESTQCPRCGTENRPGLAFCRNCGQRLMDANVAAPVERPGTPEGTQACPRCGTHNRAATAFCQNCGANLRASAAPGYVPPAVASDQESAETTVTAERAHAILGPIVLLIGAIGMTTAWLLPFPYGAGSLFERASGAGGYGASFWNGYPEVRAQLADQGYFGFAAPAPLLILLLVVLAIAGVTKARPGTLQWAGLVIALVWSIGLAALFVVAEVLGGSASDLAGMLRNLTPGGIIFFLASLIVLIGTITRFARG